MWPFTEIERILTRLAWKATRPCGFHVRLLTQRDTILVYAVSAAPPVDADVVTRRLTVTVNGVAAEPVDFAPDATSLGEVSAADGDVVVLVLVDIDDAGNASSPSEITFTAADTIPPAAPELGVTLVREE